jgi:SAM-dependent methyltransferase
MDYPAVRKKSGGYDEGYEGSSCLWGGEPGSLVRRLVDETWVAGRAVLDLGAGEGKNAYFLADQGAEVTAVEISVSAIRNGRNHFGDCSRVEWVNSDVVDFPLSPCSFEIVVCYGLFHCLSSRESIMAEVRRVQECTVGGGWNVLCAFNDRFQDLSAHPGFHPTLLSHGTYMGLYEDWEISAASDRNLTERHPHNELEHSHSMTRILARRKTDA